jgi:hypothetical protein
MALPPGTKLGPYEIVAQLGAGGMGEVYRARDTRLERDVAVKVLPASLASDANLRQRLEREAKAVSKLSHPHICTLHDIGHQDGVDFLVMELVEGETLEHRLVKGPLPSDQVLRYAAQIADALAKAHKVGITHRDCLWYESWRCFNIAQNFSANFLYALPAPQHGLVQTIAGGWQIGGIITLSTGVPFPLAGWGRSWATRTELWGSAGCSPKLQSHLVRRSRHSATREERLQ